MKSARLAVAAFVALMSWSAAGSANPHRESVSFSSLSGNDGKPPAVIPAELYVPADRAGPFAAVVLVHGSGGVADFREHWYAREFAARGFAALVIDSFKPRGVTSTVEDQTRVTTPQMIQDAYAALAFLAADKRIDPTRIGVMGFSKGGTVALWSAMKAVGDRAEASGGTKQRFAFHLPFYPGCNFQYRSPATTGGPILMMLGELDDYTQPQTCIGYAKRLQAGGVLFRLGGDGGQAPQCATRQVGKAGVAPRRFLRQACVRQQQGDALFPADVHQIRPDLGFHDDAHDRPEVLEEAPHGKGVVVGQVGAQHAVAERVRRSLAAGRRHVREQNPVARVACLQCGHQRQRGARLADRDGMQPDQRLRRREIVAAEAFADVAQIFRLTAAAQEQVQPHIRQQEQQRQVVEESRHHSSPVAASMTCPAEGGAPSPPRLIALSPA